MQIEFGDVKNRKNIIDVRTKSEYQKVNLNSGTNIPRLILLKNPEKYLDKNKTYYLICSKGEISLFCAKILNAMGYSCYSINGGIEKIKKYM